MLAAVSLDAVHLDIMKSNEAVTFPKFKASEDAYPSKVTHYPYFHDWHFSKEALMGTNEARDRKLAVWIANRVSKVDEVPIILADFPANQLEPIECFRQWYIGAAPFAALAGSWTKDEVIDVALDSAEHGAYELGDAFDLLMNFLPVEHIDSDQGLQVHKLIHELGRIAL